MQKAVVIKVTMPRWCGVKRPTKMIFVYGSYGKQLDVALPCALMRHYHPIRARKIGEGAERPSCTQVQPPRSNC